MNRDIDLDKKCILYIDDNAASIEAALAIFEDDYNYAIISETSVEEGIETLENYYGTIDAIILDLSFPETTLQGKEGLQIIKEKYGWIPVFVLTGSTDPAEQTVAQECLSLGAEQVFHKDVFDVEVFMDQVTDAAHREHTSEKLKNIQNYTSKLVASPYIHLVDCETYFNGVFAFKLKNVISEVDDTAYQVWVNDLVEVVSLFMGIEVSQMYLNENGKIACYFSFILAGETQGDVLKLFNDFYFNISSFFNDYQIYQPVNFISVTDVDTVLKLVISGRSGNQPQTYDFIREHKKLSNNSTSIGFSATKSSNEEYAIPVPLEQGSIDYDVLFHHLRTVPDIVLMHKFIPVRLTVDELDMINKAKNTLTDPADRSFYESALSLLQNQRRLCALKTVCVVPRKKIPTILTLINNGFYNGNTKPVTSIKTNWSNYVSPQVRLKYLVPASDVCKVITLPKSRVSNQTTFSSERVSHQYIPAKSFDTANITVGEKDGKTLGIEPKQFQKHTYIIGKTGTGKTSVLKAMIQNRMESGDGLALIDPHGDIYEKVLQEIPKHRKKDVILFDPTDPKNKFGFSLLQYDRNFPEQKAFIVNELLKIFGELYDMKSAGGPMFETYFKNAAYLVMEVYKQPLLTHIEKVFTSTPTRKELLTHCENKRVTDFFSMAEATSGEQGFENFGPYITSKLTRFTDNELINAVISNTASSFNFREMIDSKKIFLVKLNKGRLGDEGVNFIGRLLFNKIIMAAYTRENIPEKERQDFSLFVDEFQNFTSNDIVSALGEARKYHLQLVLANQTFAQLEEKVAKNILGNVGSLITAAVSPYDAEMIAPFLEPEFTKQDIVQLDNYKFILNTQYDNKRVSPFIFNSIPY